MTRSKVFGPASKKYIVYSRVGFRFPRSAVSGAPRARDTADTSGFSLATFLALSTISLDSVSLVVLAVGEIGAY